MYVYLCIFAYIYVFVWACVGRVCVCISLRGTCKCARVWCLCVHVRVCTCRVRRIPISNIFTRLSNSNIKHAFFSIRTITLVPVRGSISKDNPHDASPRQGRTQLRAGPSSAYFRLSYVIGPGDWIVSDSGQSRPAWRSHPARWKCPLSLIGRALAQCRSSSQEDYYRYLNHVCL